MFKFKSTVYVKEGNFGWTASYIEKGKTPEEDVFIEVRPQNQGAMPKVEGYYDVFSDKGFRKYVGPTGKLSIYSNGATSFVKSSLSDPSLLAEESTLPF